VFLIAGGLTLGEMLEQSGAAAALAGAVVGLDWPVWALWLAIGGVTVLLSEMTSNTATAALMLPLTASMAEAAGLDIVKTLLLVTMSASLGFALPVSTPPNAIIYGTGLVPLRRMAAVGITLDVLSLCWIVICVSAMA
jgi:sodium-dependent dicarboxylate transporter 2/3/5